MATVNCPHCDAGLRWKEELAGRRVRCAVCDTAFRVPDEPGEEDDRSPRGRDEEERRPVRRSRRDDYDEEPEERPRRRRSSGSSFPLAGLIKVAIGVVVLGGLVVGGIFLAKALNAPPTLPANQWQTLQVPGKFTVQMPGSSTSQPVPGPVQMVMYQCNPSKSLTAGVGYSQGGLPPERKALPASRVLEDSCDGAMSNVSKMGGSEISRAWITLGRYSGRQLVVKAPRNEGKLIFRTYLVNDNIFMVMVGGRGIEPDGEIARKIFDSFQVLE